MNKITLVVGSGNVYSHHRDRFEIGTNRTTEQIKEAYKAGCKIADFDMVEVLDGKKIGIIPVERLFDLGFTLINGWIEPSLLTSPNKKINFTSNRWLELYLFMLRLGDPGGYFTPLYPDEVDIGGSICFPERMQFPF